MVGSVKLCLRKVSGNAKLSFNELEVVLAEIESTLNPRPLTIDFKEIGKEPLTPSHLLHGRKVSCMPTGIEYEDDINQDRLSKRFCYLSAKLSRFWQRWWKEYLVGLREIHRGKKHQQASIEKGDVVLVEDEIKQWGLWKTAVVEETIIGRDGFIRGAKVRTAGTSKSRVYLCRPIQKVFPLEICDRNRVEEGSEMGDNEPLLGEDRSFVKECTGEERERRVPARAAAKDASWRRCWMLDSG